MSGATLVVLVPVLRRPHRVKPLMESFAAATEDYRLLFIASDYDTTEIEALKEADADFIVTDEPEHGQYAKKINLGYRASWEPLIFLGADDLHPHPGWFEKAHAKLTPGIGVVGTNDLCNRRTKRYHSTHSLVTREYADKCGTIDERHKILYEGYPHEMVDDELVATAEYRGAYVHADDCYVEHLHPMNGKAPMDPLYAQQAARMKVGRRMYEARRHLWNQH